MAHIIHLPAELLFHISKFLDIPAILQLQRTCKLLLDFGRDRSVWLGIFDTMQRSQPLPCIRCDFENMEPLEMQRTLVAAFNIQRTFLLPRESARSLLPDHNGWTCVTSSDSPKLSTISLVLDEYTLLGYTDGTVSLWARTSDSQETKPWFLYACFLLPQNWILYDHCLSADKSVLYVAACRTSGLRAQIYTVPLGMKQASTAFPLPFEGITESDLGMQYMLRCIHPESSLLLMYEFASSIVVLNWKTGQQGIVPISWDDPEEAWIVALQLCGPFILSFAPRSIEAYPLPCISHSLRSTHHLPVLRHRFAGPVQHQVTLSDVHQSCRSSEETHAVYVLAHGLHGITYYKVTITLLNDAPPCLSVDLIGKYRITGIGVPFGRHEDSADASSESWTSASIRMGFVSHLSLGSAGMRGAWVEWDRGSMSRRVVAFTLNPIVEKSLDEEFKTYDTTSGSPRLSTPHLEGKCIWEYDAQNGDDMPLCAVSESTGRIAIGSGSGNVQLLECIT